MVKPRRFRRDVDGILLLDKALGLSSNAALQQVRSLFEAKKAGHAGSLDPLASGVLPVCFGQATKVCGRLLNAGKTYRVKVRLGARTASGDLETEVIERAPVPPLTQETIAAALRDFEGEQTQIPPMHSALKFEGKRLYELARRGETVERAARRIVLSGLKCVGFTPESVEFDVHCSKGTYIRSLADDFAVRLGTIGYVEGLRRLSVDPFGGLPIYTYDQLAGMSPAERETTLLGADAAFGDLPRVDLDADSERRILLGQSIRLPDVATFADEARGYGAAGRFIGLLLRQPDGLVRASRLFTDVSGDSAQQVLKSGANADFGP